MNRKLSLQQFLARRYIGIFSAIFFIFSVVVSFINLNTMDDTTEYYMLYEAQVLSEYYKKEDIILEFDSGIKEYFWGFEQLPNQYKQFLKSSSLTNNSVSLFESDIAYIYILPYKLTNQLDSFYVIHIFDKDSQRNSEYELRVQLSILFFIALFFVMFYIHRTNRQVLTQVNSLDNWLKTLNIENIHSSPLPKNLTFEELTDTATVVSNSYIELRELNLQKEALLITEQEFLSTLSHELRTPIAIITAACALLDKRNELTKKDKNVLTKLNNANNNMTLLTDTLLQLWRKQPVSDAVTKVSLEEILLHVIEQSDLDIVMFEITNINNKPFDSQITLISIVISNLLRNAYQYIANGKVEITIDKDIWVISNHFDSTQQVKNNEKFGFGIGLYLVEKICIQNKWLIQTDTKDSIFSVKIQFRTQTII